MSDHVQPVPHTVEGYLISLMVALATLVLGWLVARLTAAAMRRMFQRTGLAHRLADWLGQEQEAEGIARLASHLVSYTVLLFVVIIVLQSLVLPVIADPARQLVDQIGTYGQGLIDKSPIRIPIEILLTLIATVVLGLTLRLMGKLFPRLYARIGSWKGTWIRPLFYQRVEILSAERISDIFIIGAKYVRGGIAAVLLYLYVSVVFSFFPATETLAAQLFGYAVSALTAVWQAFVAYLPSALLIVVIILITRYVMRLVRFVFTEIGKGTITIPGFYSEWSGTTFKIVRLLIFVLAAVMVFPYLPGSATPAFQGVTIFLGFLFSLGSTAVVANIVAGVVLTYMRAFDIGDRVQIADTVGDVLEKTLLVTRVRTIKNVDITIPNAMVLGSHIVNFSSSVEGTGLILHTAVTIGYDVPWRKVHELLIAAARATQHILEEPAPFVLQTSLDDFYVSYELNAYTREPNRMAAIYSELLQNVQDQFNGAGVEILSPHYTALRDGHHTTIPEDYVPESYSPPAFRVSPLGRFFTRVESGRDHREILPNAPNEDV
jgi:small-conductance mechanosensitive channel